MFRAVKGGDDERKKKVVRGELAAALVEKKIKGEEQAAVCGCRRFKKENRKRGE